MINHIAVIGSRSFNNYILLKETLNKIVQYGDILVSGGASGADRLAEQYSRDYNVPILVYRAQWDKYGKSAGIIRNKKIVDKADKLVAFWDGASRGTLNSINLARNKNIPVIIIKF